MKLKKHMHVTRYKKKIIEMKIKSKEKINEFSLSQVIDLEFASPFKANHIFKKWWTKKMMRIR